MKRLLIRGPMLTNSGYGVHSRQICRWIFKNLSHWEIRAQVTPWGITPWYINPEDLGGLVGQIMSVSAPVETQQDVSIQIQLPNEWDTTLAKVNIGVTAGVETSKCNPEWIVCINRMTCVVVPSNFIKKTFENSGQVTVPIYVIPEAFYEEITAPSEVNLDISTKFNFLMVAQLTNKNPDMDRKNLFYGLKWLCEIFKDDPDVGIVLKTNHGTNTKIDKRIVKNLLNQLISEIRPGPYPKIHLLHGSLSQAEMAGLYRDKKIKALFAPTRGEGWGLPILEAAASALPVITTKYSGHMDFLKYGRFIELDYDLVPVHPELVKCIPNIFTEGAKWAHPQENDVKKKLKKFRKNSAIPRRWAIDLAKKIGENFSQEGVELEYTKLLSGYFE